MPGRSFHLYSNRESKIWISVEMPSRQSDKLIAINCKSIKMYPLGTIYTCTKSSSYHIYNCWNISVLTKTMDHPFHMIPSIQRAPVYDTYFFPCSGACVCVCVLLQDILPLLHPRHPLCLSLCVRSPTEYASYSVSSEAGKGSWLFDCVLGPNSDQTSPQITTPLMTN